MAEHRVPASAIWREDHRAASTAATGAEYAPATGGPAGLRVPASAIWRERKNVVGTIGAGGLLLSGGVWGIDRTRLADGYLVESGGVYGIDDAASNGAAVRVFGTAALLG